VARSDGTRERSARTCLPTEPNEGKTKWNIPHMNRSGSARASGMKSRCEFVNCGRDTTLRRERCAKFSGWRNFCAPSRRATTGRHRDDSAQSARTSRAHSDGNQHRYDDGMGLGTHPNTGGHAMIVEVWLVKWILKQEAVDATAYLMSFARPARRAAARFPRHLDAWRS
jgi:hypothetical protein